MAGQAPGGPVIAPPAPPALPPPQAPATDIAGMQAQVADLRVELAGVQAQWDGLQAQLNSMLKTNPARPGVAQKWADVGMQRAEIQGKIAQLNARISQLGGTPAGTTRAPSGGFPGGINPGVALPISAVLFVVLAYPIVSAWAKRLARGTPAGPALSPDHLRRLDRMENAIDAVAIEVERISEGQRFVTRILAERPAERAAAAPSSPMSDEPAPLRALGAGPAEPIRVPERERVQERNDAAN